MFISLNQPGVLTHPGHGLFHVQGQQAPVFQDNPAGDQDCPGMVTGALVKCRDELLRKLIL
jgi:hypothetical protein